MDILALIIAIGLGFGLSCWILGRKLDESNNIGDSTGSRFQYSADVHFTVSKDRLSNRDRESFCSDYAKKLEDPYPAVNPSTPVRRLTEKEREEYGVSSAIPMPSEPCEKPDLEGVFAPVD